MKKQELKKKKVLKRFPLTDEFYGNLLQMHQPLIRYVVETYVEEENNLNKATIAVGGSYSLPIAIEFAQWRYDTSFLAGSPGEIDEVPGYLVKYGITELLTTQEFAFKEDQKWDVIVLVDVIKKLHKQRKLKPYLKNLLQHCKEVVISVDNDRDWSKILVGDFMYVEAKYPENKWKSKRLLISLKSLDSLSLGQPHDVSLPEPSKPQLSEGQSDSKSSSDSN